LITQEEASVGCTQACKQLATKQKEEKNTKKEKKNEKAAAL
jgi:hypothetical protein